jgi:hypothetical protein
MEQKFKQGDRAKLTRDLLDPAEYHPVNLYKGDEGIITEHPTKKGLLGFKSDRWGDIISFSDLVDGERRATIDFCELVEASPLTVMSARYWGACGKCGNQAELGETGLCPVCLDKLTNPKSGVEISAILESEKPKKLNCALCGRAETVDRITWECEMCGANFRDEDDAEDCVICGSEADDTIAVCKECKQDLIAHMPEVDYKGIEAQLSNLQPLRYEIKTLLQDLDDSSAADFLLSQCLNEGWEILELTHLSVYIGPESGLAFRRVVTLRRAVDVNEWAKKELEKAQPVLQTLSSAFDLFKDILETDGEDGQ